MPSYYYFLYFLILPPERVLSYDRALSISEKNPGGKIRKNFYLLMKGVERHVFNRENSIILSKLFIDILRKLFSFYRINSR